MSALDLDALEKLLRYDGPWHHDEPMPRGHVCDRRCKAVTWEGEVAAATRTALPELIAEVRRLRDAHDSACALVARMHEAAVGSVRGPIVGVVEDVERLRLGTILENYPGQSAKSAKYVLEQVPALLDRLERLERVAEAARTVADATGYPSKYVLALDDALAALDADAGGGE